MRLQFGVASMYSLVERSLLLKNPVSGDVPSGEHQTTNRLRHMRVLLHLKWGSVSRRPQLGANIIWSRIFVRVRENGGRGGNNFALLDAFSPAEARKVSLWAVLHCLPSPLLAFAGTQDTSCLHPTIKSPSKPAGIPQDRVRIFRLSCITIFFGLPLNPR